MSKFTPSIVGGVLSGGSQAEPHSSQRRRWNQSWTRFYQICVTDLSGYLTRHFPNLNHQDAEEVLISAVLKTYRSLKTKFDPSRDKMEAWLFRDLRGKALDKLRQRRLILAHEAVALDAALIEGEGLMVHEVLGAEDQGFDAAEEEEVKNERQDKTALILETLVRIGKCSTEKVAIYRDIVAGGAPEEVAARHHQKRSYVDSLKNEMNGRLKFITARMEEGVSMEEAAQASRAKNNNA
jgi:DNA-directed RNA polymerase specialized sigma24 family protein